MRIRSQGATSGRHRKHEDLNLTAFIDILSMLIFFLVFNMSLNEVAAIQTNMGSDKAATTVIKEPVKELSAELKIAITKDNVELWDRGRVNRIPIVGAQTEFDWTPVGEFLKNARISFPQKKDIIVQSRDDVLYGMVIRAMDYSLAEGFRELVVMGVE